MNKDMPDSLYVGNGKPHDFREKSRKMTDKEIFLFMLNKTMPCALCGKSCKFDIDETDMLQDQTDLYVCFCKCSGIMVINKDNDNNYWWLDYA